MLKKRFILILLFGMPFLALSQADWYHYNWEKDGVPDKLSIYGETYSSNSIKYKGSQYLGPFDQKFISQCSINLYQNIECGNIYKSLEGYEDYIRKVLESVIGDIQICKKISICFNRDVEFNASMSESGLLKINVGMLPQLNNEAELALILAHEVGHYLNDDVVKNYGRLMELRYNRPGSGIFGMINSISSSNNYYAFSRENESAADVNAMRFINASDFSFESCLGSYRTMQYLQLRDQLREGKIRKNWRTHPYALERLDYLESLASSRIKHGSKNYVVDSLAFNRLKTICRQECVNISLADGDYDDLITMSFSRYLLEPTDGENLAVLVEAVRRKLNYSANENISEKQFILYQYLGPLSQKYLEFQYLNNRKLSILQCLDKGLVNIWPEQMNLIKAGDLKDTTVIEFKTYMEAYLYFKEKASDMKLVSAKHYQFFGQAPDYTSAQEFITDNKIFLTNDFIRNKGQVVIKDTNLFVLIPVWSSYSPYPTHPFELDEYKKLNTSLRSHVSREFENSKVLTATELGMEAQRSVYNLWGYAYAALKNTPALLGVQTSDVNWFNYCPEMYNLFKTNGIANLYLCQVNALDEKRIEFEFYKISLPGTGKYTFTTKKVIKKLKYVDSLYPDFEEAGKEFRYFVKYTSK